MFSLTGENDAGSGIRTHEPLRTGCPSAVHPFKSTILSPAPLAKLGYPCIFMFIAKLGHKGTAFQPMVGKSAVTRALVRVTARLAKLGYPCTYELFRMNNILVYKPFSYVG